MSAGSTFTPGRLVELIRELDAGRLDGAAVKAAGSGGSLPRFLRAIALAKAGRDEEARADVEAAIAGAPGEAWVRLLGARFHAAIGDLPAARAEIDRLLAVAPRSRAALELRFELDFRLGRQHEALGQLGEIFAAEASSGPFCLMAARLLESRRDWGTAYELLRRAMATTAPAAQLEIQAADLLHRLGRDAEARAALDRGTELAPGHLAARFEAVELSVRLGDLDAAERHARAAIAADPTSAAAHVALGRLRLWAADAEGARALAEDALAFDPDHGPAHRTRGAAAILAGRFEEAERDLDRAVALDPEDAEALIHRGEARLGEGRFDEAFADLDRAVMIAGQFILGARLLRLLVTIRSGPGWAKLGRTGADEIRDGVLALCPDGAAVLDAGDVEPLTALLLRAVARLGGNRTATPTAIGDGGHLRAIRVPPGPRAAARVVLERIATRPPAEVLADFDALIEQYAWSGLPRCHRGELNLWLGRYDDARADLERTIAEFPRTRWAYIGMTAAEMLQGRCEEAIAVCERGVRALCSVGTSVYVHRGEALRRLGRIDEARSDLLRATELHPTRITAWMNLALCHGAAGEHAEAARAFARIRPSAPWFFAEVASEAGVALDPGEPPSPEALRAVLEVGLARMKGNRSSTFFTYVTANGELRCATAAPARERRVDDLGRLRAYLERSVKVRR